MIYIVYLLATVGAVSILFPICGIVFDLIEQKIAEICIETFREKYIKEIRNSLVDSDRRIRALESKGKRK